MSHTHGQLRTTHRDGQALWEMEVVPHVAMRAKRIFGRISRGERGLLCMTQTAEVSRDLVWLLTRYPLQMSDDDRLLLERLARAHDELAESLDAVLSGRVDPRSFELAVPLRRYQAQAAEAALQSGGLLLADDVGLGKTAVAIGALSGPGRRPALVVTLTHLTKQWEREFARFAPQLRTHIAKKGTAYNLTSPKKARAAQAALFSDEPDVLIMNYHKLAGWEDALVGRVCSVVFDECQELRRPESQKYRAAQRIAGEASLRLGLSATPIYNYGGEFHAVMECLRPGVLGTSDEFRTEWCSGTYYSRNVRISEPRAFGAYVRDAGLMLRRTREEVGRQLPAVSIAVHHVDTDAEAMTKGADTLSELCRLVLTDQPLGRAERMSASQEFDWRLRQQTGLAKSLYVARFVELLVESGEQVVLYGWHRLVYEAWGKNLAHFSPVFFTGKESIAGKERARQAFMSGDSRVLCMSLRAGAGLDGLQEVCSTVVFGELDWSPGVHTQCIGRVDRDGQKRPVVAYYLVADEGSDPVVSDVLGLKRQQIEAISDPDAPLAQPVEVTDRIRNLARSYVARHGSVEKLVPTPATTPADP